VAESGEPEGPAPAFPKSDPMGKEFNYAEEFKTLDLKAVIKDCMP
jgi:catalase (peroxidase I)